MPVRVVRCPIRLMECTNRLGPAALARATTSSVTTSNATGVGAASGDLGNFSGYKMGSPDYERLINVVHDATIAAFRAALHGDRLHHAWLLTGPQGVGKFSTAMQFARRMLAEGMGLDPATPGIDVPFQHPAAKLLDAWSHPDFALIDRLPKDDKVAAKPRLDWPEGEERARSIKVAQVRALNPLFATVPSMSSRRVIVIDEKGELVDGDAVMAMCATRLKRDGAPLLRTSLAAGARPDFQNPDSDDDGLWDDEEVLVHFTDPHLPDSDGDGYNDSITTLPTEPAGLGTADTAPLPSAVAYIDSGATNQRNNPCQVTLQWDTSGLAAGNHTLVVRLTSHLGDPAQASRTLKVGTAPTVVFVSPAAGSVRVRPGDRVARGQPMAKAGSSGSASGAGWLRRTRDSSSSRVVGTRYSVIGRLPSCAAPSRRVSRASAISP